MFKPPEARRGNLKPPRLSLPSQLVSNAQTIGNEEEKLASTRSYQVGTIVCYAFQWVVEVDTNVEEPASSSYSKFSSIDSRDTDIKCCLGVWNCIDLKPVDGVEDKHREVALG